MKTIILTGAAALSFAAGASAQVPAQPPADITRAAAVADAERNFAALDTDADGQLSAAELQKAGEQRRAERKQRMDERLARMSPEERAAFEKKREEWRGRGDGRDGARGPRGGEARRGPQDGRGFDGPVSRADFVARAVSRFDRLDLDRDGVITAAEQAQLRARRQAPRGE